MKRNQAFPSTYLGKEDVPAPFTAVITDVRPESLKTDTGTESKPVLHFEADQLKPLILNNTNWITLEDAYGEESDHWRGRPIEIYVDPGVMFGGRRVGGVRVRIPAAAQPAAVPAQKPPPAAAPAPKPVPPQAPAPKTVTLLDRHAQVLAGYAQSRSATRLSEWRTWAAQFPFTQEQEDDLSDAYHAALERIQSPAPDSRPALKRGA